MKIYLAIGILVLIIIGGGLYLFSNESDEITGAHEIESVTVTDNEILDQTGSLILSNDTVPGGIKVDEDSEFGAGGQFTSATLSPDNSLIAFTMSGVAHSGGWIAELEQGTNSQLEVNNITPAAFQYGGDVEVIEWSPDSRFVAYSLSTPVPSELLWVADSNDLTVDYVSEIGQQIEVQEEAEMDPSLSYEFTRWEAPHTLCFVFADQDEQCIDV